MTEMRQTNSCIICVFDESDFVVIISGISVGQTGDN